MVKFIIIGKGKMKKRNNLSYFLITLTFFTYLNFYGSNLIAYKLMHNWHYTNALFSIVYTQNTGAAFSIMQNSTAFLIGLSIISFFAIIFYIIKNIAYVSFKITFFASLLLSGILGNLYERITFGYVRDFFNLNFVNFPIFNISDIFINIGVVGIIILILLIKTPVRDE